MPGMGDPRFHQAVIFLVSHHAQGAMGVVINHPLTDLSLPDLLKEAGLDQVEIKRPHVRLVNGGPVERQHGFVIHTADFEHEHTVKVTEALSVSANLEALEAFVGGECPRDALLALGYAGWGADQLEKEIQENAWLVVDADLDILFQTNPEEMWNRAYSRLGVDPVLLSPEAGRA